MAYAYQAAQFNLDVDDKDMERMQTALAEQGDIEAANKVLEKKAQHIARGMTANPFVQLNSSAASLQAILNESSVSGEGETKSVRKYTNAELNKFATEMGKHVNFHDDFRKQEKKKQRRIEDRIISQFHAEGKSNVVILPESLAGLTGASFGSDVVAVTASNKPATTNTPVSAIAAISKTTSLSTLAAANAINQGILNKKHKNVLNTLFDTAGDFSESDDDDEHAPAPAANDTKSAKAKDKDVVMSAADAKRLEEEKKAAEIAKAIELAKQEAKAAKVVGTGPTVVRTDKAAVISRNLPVAVPITAVSGTGPVTNAQMESQNPYAVNFKVISAKPAARRAAAAAKRALMDESDKRQFDKRTAHMHKERILMSGTGDSSEDDDEESSEDDLDNVMGEEDRKVKFESWDLVKKVGSMEGEKPKKVLFDASKGGMMRTASGKTVTTAVTTTQTSKTQDSGKNTENSGAANSGVRTSSQPTVVVAKKGGVDSTVPKKPVAIAVMAGGAGVKRKAAAVESESSDEENADAADEDQDADVDEDMEDEDGMILYDDEDEDGEMDEDEDDEDMEPIKDDAEEEEEKKEQDPYANLAPPRKGLRFDGSKMGFQELLKRVMADLAADSEDEQERASAEAKPVVKAKKSDKAVENKVADKQKQDKKEIIAVKGKKEEIVVAKTSKSKKSGK